MLIDVMKTAFDDELQKIAESKKKDHTLRNTALAVGGAAGLTVAGMKAVKDRPNEWEKLRRAQVSAKGIATNLLNKAKHAGALQGHVRGGRRPLSATTLLDKEKESAGENRKKLADMMKVSGLSAPDARTLGLIGIGMYGMHRLNKARRRYEMGRQMEMQSQGMY